MSTDYSLTAQVTCNVNSNEKTDYAVSNEMQRLFGELSSNHIKIVDIL